MRHVRITTGVAQTPGYSTIMDGPLQSEWDAMTPYQRHKYLEGVRLATIELGVDAWAEVAEEGE